VLAHRRGILRIWWAAQRNQNTRLEYVLLSTRIVKLCLTFDSYLLFFYYLRLVFVWYCWPSTRFFLYFWHSTRICQVFVTFDSYVWILFDLRLVCFMYLLPSTSMLVLFLTFASYVWKIFLTFDSYLFDIF
jgi:hypothetical protein